MWCFAQYYNIFKMYRASVCWTSATGDAFDGMEKVRGGAAAEQLSEVIAWLGVFEVVESCQIRLLNRERVATACIGDSQRMWWWRRPFPFLSVLVLCVSWIEVFLLTTTSKSEAKEGDDGDGNQEIRLVGEGRGGN